MNTPGMCLQSARIDSTLQVWNWKQNPNAHCAWLLVSAVFI